MSWTPKYTVNQEILSCLMRIEKAKESFEKAPLSPKLLASLHQSAKLASTHFSTQIEGNELSLEDVKSAVSGGAKFASGKIGHDTKEVQAYYQAINQMEKFLEEDEPLSEGLIQKIHALVEGKTKPSAYRDVQNAIYNASDGALVYLPPEAKDVPDLMSDLLNWLHKSVQALPVPIVAGVLHYQFVTIHPYLDGNGRTARLLTDFLMRKYGYGLKGIFSLEEYYAQDLAAYYQALETHPHHNYYYGRNAADITSWLVYFLSGLAQSFETVAQKAEETPSRGEGGILLRALDVKQRQILSLFTTYQEVTSAQVGEYLGFSAQSARLLLNRWVQGGFLEIGRSAKKNRTYKLSAEYEKLIF